MTSVYNLLRETCGISQAEAAEHVHGTRLDTVKSWCSDRRPVPPGALEELQQLFRKIRQAGDDYAAQLKTISQGDVYIVGLPKDEQDARVCGFPGVGAQMRAIGIAIAQLPAGAEIRMVERVRGAIPSVVMEKNRPQAAKDDHPDPSPGGFQSHVNADMRRPKPRAR